MAPAYLADTWEWDGTGWTLRQPAQAPAPRGGAALGFDPAGRRLILFGGMQNSTTFGDTWAWDGSNWQPLAPASTPMPRGSAALHHDAHRGRLVLAGGVLAAPPAGFEVWEWDGTTWTQRYTTQDLRMRATSAFDQGRGRLLVLEGNRTSSQVEFRWPGDLVGPGHGALRALNTPLLGEPLLLDFATTEPLLLAWTIAGAQRPPAVRTGAPWCGAEPLYLFQPGMLLLAATGPILSVPVPADPGLAFLPITAQALVLDPAGCVRISDALSLRLQPD